MAQCTFAVLLLIVLWLPMLAQLTANTVGQHMPCGLEGAPNVVLEVHRK